MIPRLLAPHIQAALEQYPAVAILGPRQIGKTTLALHLLQNEKHAPIYLDLMRPYAFLATYYNKIAAGMVIYKHNEDRVTVIFRHKKNLVVIDQDLKAQL